MRLLVGGKVWEGSGGGKDWCFIPPPFLTSSPPNSSLKLVYPHFRFRPSRLLSAESLRQWLM